MAYSQEGIDITRPAGADLSSSQFLFVKNDSSGNVILCSAAGEDILGVLQNKPTLNQGAVVRVFGVTKLVAGGSISLSGVTRITTTSAGKAAAATTADRPAGVLLEASGGNGALVTALINIGYVDIA